jgi:ATP-dependent DNA helicase RecG
MVNQFVRELPFKLTGDQLTCIRDIVLDMESDTIMFRLLQGDVGTGKTIVSFAALYANYLRGLQGVLIAPTFELASQHYQKALKIFERYSIKSPLSIGNTVCI